MVSQMVEIAATAPRHVMVKPLPGGCHSCSSTACGVAGIARLFSVRAHLLKVAGDGHRYRVGDVAELRFDEKLLVISAVLQYLLPLFSMLILLVVADFFALRLAGQVVVAAFGLAAGVIIARLIVRWREYRPGARHLHIRPLSRHDA